LHFSGSIQVRHMIHVLVEDVGLAEIKKRVTRPLKDLRVAPYYGCQIVRPSKEGEDTEQPQFFEDLLTAIGATPVNFPPRLRCCGGSLIMTNRKAALTMIRDLLQSAADGQADVIATACPLCQLNLECYQRHVNRMFGTQLVMPILYFTQLTGLALGAPAGRLGIGSELIPVPALAAG
jgi:heterodisulfide reductase subunit B2